jgi:hypothetical protein
VDGLAGFIIFEGDAGEPCNVNQAISADSLFGRIDADIAQLFGRDGQGTIGILPKPAINSREAPLMKTSS